MISITAETVDNFLDVISIQLPLERIGRELAERMRRRIHEQGLAGDGAPWGTHPDGTPERFRRTGEFAASIEVAINGGSVSIRYNDQPHSGSGRLTNAALAQVLFADERMGPMRPTAGELEWVRQEVARLLPPMILKPAALSGAGLHPSSPLGGRQLLQGGVR